MNSSGFQDRSRDPKRQRTVQAEGQHDHQELKLGLKPPFVGFWMVFHHALGIILDVGIFVCQGVLNNLASWPMVSAHRAVH